MAAAKIGPALVWYSLSALAFSHQPGKRASYIRKVARALGKVHGLCGGNFHEYAVIHGK
jgi:hypothetical protein